MSAGSVTAVVASNRDALLDWVTLGGSQSAPAGARDVEDAVLAARSGEGPEALRGRLERILAHGLAVRDGMHLAGRHLAVFLQLRDQLGAEPVGHAVCDDCRLVFLPKRKRAGVAKCDVCDHSRAQPAFTRVEHADGEGWSLAGLMAGTLHFRRCQCCGDEFVAKTAATLYCCGACRKAAAEGRRREPDPLLEVDPELLEDRRERLGEILPRAIAAYARRARAAGITGRDVIDERQAQARVRRDARRG
jgi:ribosomal protein L37AE/L43A